MEIERREEEARKEKEREMKVGRDGECLHLAFASLSIFRLIVFFLSLINPHHPLSTSIIPHRLSLSITNP